MSLILQIDTSNKAYNEWNNDGQCVSFVKGTQNHLIYGDNQLGAIGNGIDVAKTLITKYGYANLNGTFKKGAVLSINNNDEYGHVVFINDITADGTIIVSEGNYDGKSSGNWRTKNFTSSELQNYLGGSKDSCIHPSLLILQKEVAPPKKEQTSFTALRVGKSKLNGEFTFPMSVKSNFVGNGNGFKLQEDTRDIYGELWLETTTFNSMSISNV